MTQVTFDQMGNTAPTTAMTEISAQEIKHVSGGVIPLAVILKVMIYGSVGALGIGTAVKYRHPIERAGGRAIESSFRFITTSFGGAGGKGRWHKKGSNKG